MAPLIIDGKKIADDIRAEVSRDAEELRKKHGITPGLAVVIVGQDPPSVSYVKSKRKACEKLGMYSEEYALPESTSQDELITLVRKLNEKKEIHGILVQMPLPRHIRESAIINAIDPEKDVDGFHPITLGKLLIGEAGFRPCTPFGIQKMLEHAGIPTSGAHVVVVGRSNIVGKPIAAMLMQKGKTADATVTVCHSRTRDLPAITRQADILIAAIGKPEMITADMVKEGAVVIDVGINRVPDSGKEKGYRMTGDVKFDEVAPKCKAISPVPGGVGLMTIAMLMYNTVMAARMQAGNQ
jgi:methylenetetrahydrofolate dehydrogenase (NADP+)/methenyltetrahydrofolate cyclohydrolase